MSNYGQKPVTKIVIDIREEIIEAFGESTQPGRAKWDAWEDEIERPEGFTPYDISLELYKAIEIAGPDEYFRDYYSRKEARDYDGSCFPEELYLQSLLADLYKDLIFDKPQYRNLGLHSMTFGDGYLNIFLNEVHRPWTRQSDSPQW